MTIATLDDWGRAHFGAPTLAAFASAQPPALTSAPHASRNPTSATGLHEHARALRARLVGQGFTEAALPTLLGVPLVPLLPAGEVDLLDTCVLPRSPAGDLARLFVLHRVVAEATVRDALSPSLLDFCVELGLVRPVPGGLQALVSLFWCRGLLIATDAWIHGAVWPGEPRFPDRVMYLGMDSVGLAFLAPPRPGARVLDLCTGSGVQALVAAACGADVTGVDINPRAVRFAYFNAAMNGIERATFLHGDLYEPLPGTYDLILANPPFVPAPPDAVPILYRDAGARGESVLERIVAGAPAHLSAGGALLVVSDLVDVGTLPERLRAWWAVEGPRIRLFLEKAYPFGAYAAGHAAGLNEAERVAATRRLYRQLRDAGLETLHFGYLLMWDGRAALSRPDRVDTLGGALDRVAHPHLEAILTAEAWLARGAPSGTLRACPGLGLRVDLRPSPAGGLRSTPRAVVEGDPFFDASPLDAAGVAVVKAVLEGPVAWEQLTAGAIREAAVELLERGYVRVEK